MNNKKPFILQINAGYTHGGASRIAVNLLKEIKNHGFDSKFATGCVDIPNSDFIYIPKNQYTHAKNSWEKLFFLLCRRTNKLIGKIKGAGRLTNLLYKIGKPSCFIKNLRGIENFDNFPGTLDFFKNLKQTPNLVHCHNLHGQYFDLQVLPAISQKIPVILTLHDEWMFTGHCANTFDCENWKAGCGKCPYLSTYPALWRDTSAYNVKQKHSIYKKSKLHIVTPSQWLMKKVKKSVLSSGATSYNVINNGIDLKIFRPGDKPFARDKKDLNQNSHIIIFIAHELKTNPFKDYLTLEKALFHIAEKKNFEKQILLLCIGEKNKTIKKNNIEIRFIEYVKELDDLVKYYQSADILVHAAKGENFPTTILEAMACGLPVIGTNVGGIPEQIGQNVTGLLYKPQDHVDLANKISFLLSNKSIQKIMSKNAAKKANSKFDLKKQTDKYINLYKELLEKK